MVHAHCGEFGLVHSSVVSTGKKGGNTGSVPQNGWETYLWCGGVVWVAYILLLIRRGNLSLLTFLVQLWFVASAEGLKPPHQPALHLMGSIDACCYWRRNTGI
jgi:hypothetical protein